MSLANAILFETVETVASLLTEAVDLEALDEYGFPPLIEAAIANKVKMAELLLQHGALVDQTDATGRTALHWAVENHNLALCRLLLAHGADPNAYTHAGQPLLVYPLLRNQTLLKQLLYQHGAVLAFAQDFIQAKLLGHRYELTGQVDIVNVKSQFISVDYEGFFLEFTLDIIQSSLKRYYRHYMARTLHEYFPYLTQVIQAFQNASQLLQYQRYTIDIRQASHAIDSLLKANLLLLPVAYEGHAISFIKYRRWLARCDRGEHHHREGSIIIYEITQPDYWTPDFVKHLLYRRQTRGFITQDIHSILGLKPIAQIPMEAQVIGNCAWANIEASIPTMLFLLQLAKTLSASKRHSYQENALKFYKHWLQWDKDRALEECYHAFPHASPARKATKIALLAAILFQTYKYERTEDLEKAAKFVPLLMTPEYQYVLKSYLKIYWKSDKTLLGRNLMQLLDDCGILL